MAIRTYTNWNKRPTDQHEKKEPYRKYFFICEGANTEQYYFQRFIENRKALGIHSTIDIRLLEKTDEDRTISFPAELIKLAERLKRDGNIGFDIKRDKMVIVFDADVFEFKSDRYDEIIELGEDNNILAISNPSFELFLILHYEGSVEEIILPNSDQFFDPARTGNQTFAYQTVRDLTGMNPKKNSRIGELADKVLTAIEQEKKINQDIHQCKGHITCNVGQVLESIINDKGESN